MSTAIGKILRRRDDEATSAEDRFGEEPGDNPRRRRDDELLEVLRTSDVTLRIGELERTAIAIRRRRVDDRGDLVGLHLPGGLPRQRARHRRASAVRVAQRDDGLRPGSELGQQYRGFVRFGAARREEGLVQFARSDLGELLGELDDRRRRVQSRDVGEGRGLFLDRRGDFRMTVPDVDRHDAGEEVEVFSPLEVVEMNPPAALQGERRFVVVEHRVEDVSLVLLVDALGLALLDGLAHRAILHRLA